MVTATSPLPVLQIVHISDLHFHVGPAPQHDQIVRRAIAAVLAVSPKRGQWLLDYWEDGRAGHALDALVAFECFLTGGPLPTEPPGTPQYTSGNSVLKGASIPTWLVDTGDLASAGDDASVQREIDWVDRMATLMGARETIRLYGNHDAWPERFPFISSKNTIALHRTQFRNKHFPAAWPPVYPKSIALGSTGNRIDLYGVNSVIHDRRLNTRAHGQIKVDPHWGGLGSKDQLPELRGSIAQRSKSVAGRAFRILLSHHPVHYPPPAPTWTMSLRDASGVARQLINSGGGSIGPLAHLVLSGHTHQLYPSHGALPPNAGTPHHPPLGLQQLQLVVGSLSKAIRGVPVAAYNIDGEPHQCQVLRFYEVPGHPDSIEMRRAVVGRNNGTHRFNFKQLPSGGYWESTFLMF